jgi:hypothetical protein
MSYPLSQHSSDILGPSAYQDHKVIQAEQNGVDTEFLTIFYPYQTDEVMVSSIEEDNEYIALLIDRNLNKYDIIIAQSQNNLIDIEGYTTINGDSIPSMQTTANFLLISLEKNTMFSLSNIRLFGNDDIGDDLVTINDETFSLLTDPVLSNTKVQNQSPNNFILHHNYPNPFNPVTLIKYDLPIDITVSINILDLKGRYIKSLVNKYKSAGYHSVPWDGTNNFGELVSAGMYIYSIQTGDFITTKKMVLLK